MAVHVKICGVTTIRDALLCVREGATIGLNFVPESPRCISVQHARTIADAVGGRALLVGVVRDMTLEGMLALKAEVGLGCLQLHGDETPEVLGRLLPHAYKALRVGSEEDVSRASLFPGEHLLVDAKVGSALGGTGVCLDWTLIDGLARTRKLTLAGGLNPENVTEAIRRVRPFCVDVASGVERAPGVKDPSLVAAFMSAARRAG